MTDTVHVCHGTVQLWMDNVDEDANVRALSAMVQALEYDCRFVMRQDQEILKRHKRISQWHFEGKNGDLRVKARRCGRNVEVEFFTEPRYPGNSFQDRMSDYQRRMVIVHARRLVANAVSIGFKFIDRRLGFDADAYPALDPTHLNVRNSLLERSPSSPLDQFNSVWGRTRFDRDESGWPTEKEYLIPCWAHADNACARVGTTVYVVHKGRMVRGQAYPNMNGMWWVETGVGRIWHKPMSTDVELPSRPTRDQSNRMSRLREELDKELKLGRFSRVAQIAQVIERETARAA